MTGRHYLIERVRDPYFAPQYNFLLGPSFFSINITQITSNRNPTHHFTDKEQYNWLKAQILIRNSLILSSDSS